MYGRHELAVGKVVLEDHRRKVGCKSHRSVMTTLSNYTKDFERKTHTEGEQSSPDILGKPLAALLPTRLTAIGLGLVRHARHTKVARDNCLQHVLCAEAAYRKVLRLQASLSSFTG